MKKLLVVLSTLLLLAIIAVVYLAYEVIRMNGEENNHEEIESFDENQQKLNEKYINYIYEIVGELDRRCTASANIAYDYQDGKLTKEEALDQIGENALYTFNAYDTYVPYDISSLSPEDQVLASQMEVITEQLLDLYVEIQIYIQNAIDDEVYLDPWEFPSTIGMEVTDLIGELNGYQDKMLGRY